MKRRTALQAIALGFAAAVSAGATVVAPLRPKGRILRTGTVHRYPDGRVWIEGWTVDCTGSDFTGIEVDAANGNVFVGGHLVSQGCPFSSVSFHDVFIQMDMTGAAPQLLVRCNL